MCGITGIMDPRARLNDLQSIITEMADRLHSRGPDDHGAFVSESHDLALGHRRLAVIDPAASGRQPMTSKSGRMLLVFNGEIYNYKALRCELESIGCRFTTEADTEVLLEACDRWGIRQTVARLVGMFAFAVYDRHEGTLHLVRDRVGIKPLLLWTDGIAAVFGSDLRALESCPLVPSEIDPQAISSLLRYSCIMGTGSIVKGVEKVPPGTIVSFKETSGELSRTDVRYWDPVEIAIESGLRSKSLSFAEQSEMLEDMLSESVRDHLVSDVPLGCFLSGGVDSTLVAALAQKNSPNILKTFTIGMTGSHLDESPYARRIADHLGTNHIEHMVTPEEAMGLIPEMARIYDEPFADSSQLPTCLISRIARHDVTVALSGDGGDELFGGYVRYTLGLSTWRRLRRLPSPLRSLVAGCLGLLPDRVLDSSVAMLGPQDFSHRCQRLIEIMSCSDLESMNAALLTTWQDHSRLNASGGHIDVDNRVLASRFSDEEKMMIRDFTTYLVDDILTKVDRASMGVSLEARVPLLDHRVVELAWGLPLSSKIDRGNGKHILRDILSRHVPVKLFDRPKMGFSIPLATWLRGPLREWADATLADGSLEDVGLDPTIVKQVWETFLEGDSASKNGIWSMLMLSGWLQARAENAT